MKAHERLLNYVTVHTASNENSAQTPSSQCQFDLAVKLVEELKELGVKDARVDDKCYVYGHIPATKGYEKKTKIGFIAHMDTVSDFCSHQVKPIVTENYNGEDLKLGNSGRTLTTKMFPNLKLFKGRTLITSDGTTILGADDKAGIAEIMTMIETLKKEKIPHGPLSIGFTPDEEIGCGADNFNVKEFDAEFAYTLDGDIEGGIEYENFNACKAEVEFAGVNVHPGSAKDTMVNASLVAMEFNSMLPEHSTPRDTEGYEGFFHLIKMQGDAAGASLNYIIRDHDAKKFEERKEIMKSIVEKCNKKWGEGTARIIITDQYRNMSEIIKNCPHLIENAKKACERAEVNAVVAPIRGGTDGATLSFMGLPCPNLGTGGQAFHGPYEHITVEGMASATKIIIEIVKIYAE